MYIKHIYNFAYIADFLYFFGPTWGHLGMSLKFTFNISRYSNIFKYRYINLCDFFFNFRAYKPKNDHKFGQKMSIYAFYGVYDLFIKHSKICLSHLTLDQKKKSCLFGVSWPKKLGSVGRLPFFHLFFSPKSGIFT